MTIAEGDRVAQLLVDLYLDGHELIVELTGRPVLFIGIYSQVASTRFPFVDADDDEHLHAASEVTVKGYTRNQILELAEQVASA